MLNLDSRLAAIVAETADRLTNNLISPDAPATGNYGLSSIRLALLLHHDVPALRTVHNREFRRYELIEEMAEYKVQHAKPHTQVSADRAVQRANDMWPAVREAAERLRQAEDAAAADFATVVAAIGSLPEDATKQQVIDRIRDAADQPVLTA